MWGPECGTLIQTHPVWYLTLWSDTIHGQSHDHRSHLRAKTTSFSFLWLQCWSHRGCQWMWMEGMTLKECWISQWSLLEKWPLISARTDPLIWSSLLPQSVPLRDPWFLATLFDQIMNWKLLPSASAHWSWIWFLKPVCQSKSSFQVAKHFQPDPLWLRLYRHSHVLGFLWGCFVKLSIGMVQSQTT